MKNAIFAIILAAIVAPAAHAGAINLVCGNTVVTVETDAANTFESIVIGSVRYAAVPTIERKVEKGQMVSYFQAGNPSNGAVATVSDTERGELAASIYTNKTVWFEECRFTN